VGDAINNNRITITKVFYKTHRAMWRFFMFYGYLNVVGNLSNYGQYSDDSTFEVVPVWQNKAQALAYEDSIYTRLSHWSYEIFNNKIRIYPLPEWSFPDKLWIRYQVKKEPWEEYADRKIGIDGINNMNTLPYGNIPYQNINSIGKQWIRSFALALSKETLGQIRSKFSTLPIPGENLTLNGPALISEGKEMQDKLREELKTTLDEMTYNKLMETDAELIENVGRIQAGIPLRIFVG